MVSGSVSGPESIEFGSSMKVATESVFSARRPLMAASDVEAASTSTTKPVGLRGEVESVNWSEGEEKGIWMRWND